jgi:mannose-6-phosphate isomerase-like protein (cupin superfamily)
VKGCKVKELTVNPKKSLSMQKHFKRHELWHVTEGKCIVNQQMQGGYQLPPLELITHSRLSIPQGDWHQLTNPFNEPCKIVEIQYGTHCEEEDIERET